MANKFNKCQFRKQNSSRWGSETPSNRTVCVCFTIQTGHLKVAEPAQLQGFAPANDKARLELRE